MNDGMRWSRRQMMQVMAAAGFGSAFARRVVAEEPAKAVPGAAKERQLMPRREIALHPAILSGGRVTQPERGLPVVHETDVLVVGGGAAGFAAAVAAARAGAKTTIVERYGFFGGQWTGGMVLVVMGTHAVVDGKLKKTLRGIGDELLERLNQVPGGVINQVEGKYNPTVDPEATKFVMDEMIAEAGVQVLLHSWAVEIVTENGRPRGVVVEGKAGRQAILGKVIVDATGDGDVFAAAGAEYEQRLHAIGLVHRMGNVDRADRAKLKEAGFASLGSATPLPAVSWVNLRGPSTDALDTKELSRLEMEHRRSIWQRVQKLRAAPGGEHLYLLDTAPQLGVRTTRILAGVECLTRADTKASRKFPNAVAVGGGDSGKGPEWPIPYGVLVPKKVDGILAAGRCICVDEGLIESMRLIACCILTGHAAGAAAALCVKKGCEPRAVDVAALQALLREQGAYLG